MSPAGLLSQLKALGVDVIVTDGRLKVSAARGQLTAELKKAIAEQKTELVALLSNGGGGGGGGPTDASPAASTAPVPRIPRGGPLPLSFFQERLWVLSRFQPDSTAYNMVAGWPSPGPVDTARVVEAIAGIVRRHEIFRATFRDSDGVPSVHVLPPEAIVVEVRALRGEPADAQRSAIVADSARAARVPFDLRADPPARFAVYEVDGGRVVTLLAAHHIAVDAWSMALVGREIAAAYEGRELPASADALQYADFAAWQRSTLDEGAIASEFAWWKERLAGAPPVSTLPSDQARAGNPAGATRSFQFDRALSEGLRALVREERATVYMALVSICALMLNSYSGQEDIVLGSPMGVRERPEFETIIGPFVNVLVLRLDLSGDPTFAELLARTRGAVLDAHGHRQVPFEKLVDYVKPVRSLHHSPLFQVAVVQHNAAGEAVQIEGGGALFDLTWFVREAEGAFVGGLEYRSDLYSAEAIDRAAGRLEALLAAAVADRHQRLSQLVGSHDRPASPTVATNGTSGAGVTDAYWRRVLQGAPALDLPVDRPRSDARGGPSAVEPLPVPGETLDALRELARAQGTTLLAVLLAALDVVLHRHSGQGDFVVAATFAAGRLPIRVEVDPDAPFTTLLHAVHAAMTDAQEHAASFDAAESTNASVHLELAPPTLPAPAPPLEGDGVELSFLVVDGRPSQAGSVTYRTDLLDAATIRRLLGHYRSVLEAIAAEPSLPVARLPLLTQGERDELLARAGRALGAAHPTTPVVRLFEEQARRTPNATAVLDATGTLSYRALDAAADSLATRLRELGAGPGQRVAVSLERSRSVVVTLLAVLKVGAAYVPLDPRYPSDRVAYVMDDSEPVVLVTEDSVVSRLPVPPRVSVVTVVADTFLDSSAPLPPLSEADPDAIAYVMYTSGSTGRPKGVEVPNRALTNFLHSMGHTPGLTASDRVLSVTTISFDIAGLEIFLPLVTGASLQIVPGDVVTDGALLVEHLARSRATVMQATPSTWRMLIEAGWRGDRRLKILCGGEAMPRELANQLLDRAGSVWNMYGPTETTIWSTVQRVAPGEGTVPIGAPIDHTPVYLLDPYGQLVPYGVPGEIFIGGAGVARGYFRRPELTASRFVADPFAGGDARMYRTGDAGRLRADGTIEYFGRLDDQVKIRGHRIELGEIETVIREHPGVASAVVVARELQPGDLRLVGYYVLRSGSGPTSARDLRELCRNKLPKDMVPSAWVALDAIPLTPNGKTDRKALPAPTELALGEPDVERIPPRDALEAQLREIWEAVLGAPVASVRDGFFDLGGHSLLATRLFARIEQATGIALPLATLLEGSTIEHLAARIREKQSPSREAHVEPARAFSYLVPIRARVRKRGPALFCVHGAGGNVLNLYHIARHLPPDRAFYGFQSAGVDGRTPPQDTIEDMANAYLAELHAQQPSGPYYLSGFCGGGVVAYEMAQRLLASGESVAMLALIDLYRPGLPLRYDRQDAWLRAVRDESLGALVRRAQTKVTRDWNLIASVLGVRYNLARGRTMPYALRDFWLTVRFTQAVQRYRLRPYAGTLTVFRAREINKLFGDPGDDLGWSPFALGGVTAHEVPGDHKTLTDEPNVQVLAAELERSLRQAEKAFAKTRQSGQSWPPPPGTRT